MDGSTHSREQWKGPHDHELIVIANHGRIHAPTRTMEGSTRSRAHRDREPWTDPRTHDAERFLWGADTTARYSRELSSEAFGTDLAPRTASPPNSARSKHLELRGADRHGFAPRSHCSSPPGLEGTTGTVTYPRVPPTLGTLPKRLRSSSPLGERTTPCEQWKGPRDHELITRTMGGSTHARRRGTIPLGSSYNSIYYHIFCASHQQALEDQENTHSRNQPPQAT